MFAKNHQTLIKDCYPPPPSSHSDSHTLPQPVSNATSKLCFYGAGRPKKIPKVAQVLLQRAQSEASGGVTGQAGLGVTILILKELVSECRAEVGCFAEEALEVVNLGLASTSLEIKARAASLVSECNHRLVSELWLMNLFVLVPRNCDLRKWADPDPRRPSRATLPQRARQLGQAGSIR